MGAQDGDDRVALLDFGVQRGLLCAQFLSLFSNDGPQGGELILAVMARRFHGQDIA